MKRRKAIKDLLVASGGAVVLPFWMQACGNRGNDADAGMLTMVVDTIIPGNKNGSPGAVELGVDRFVERLIADCYEQPVQDNVRKQLAALERKGFLTGSQPERERLLLDMAGSADKNEKDFFMLLKNETIRGYNTSQKVMEDYFHYKVAPGHYYGCVAVKA